jgi:UDP-N-acetylglucosamine 2-epimerase (non-hydrolysing)
MICAVVGARPNFMKMAPIIKEVQRRNIVHMLVHTGQHYDEKMSQVFFDALEMPAPDSFLGVGSGSHAEQTARIMTAFEHICLETRPNLVIVAGDVNSTLACALTATKLHIPVAHVEAGLRSFDRSMPEEINRVLTDHLCDLLFTTEESGNRNLHREGIAEDKIHFVGNTMIDSLNSYRERALIAKPWQQFNLIPEQYGLVTLHRPANVDNPDSAARLAQAINQVGASIPLLFPIHPRTRAQNGELWLSLDHVRLVEPLDYLTFLGLMARAKVVITDSGGIQEETTVLGVRCVTVRENTERPVTITEGTNSLVSPRDPEEIVRVVLSENQAQTHRIPTLWDGQAATRIGTVIERWLQEQA